MASARKKGTATECTRRSFVAKTLLASVPICWPGNGLAQNKDKPAPIPMSGLDNSALAAFDQTMKTFMRENDVPGGVLAVTRHKQLVYARGFGYADRENKKPVEPTSLFRIASISKPFTAVSVLKLAERRQLELTDKVMDIVKLKPFLAEGAKADSRLKDVTIEQLLHHTGGWDRDKSSDLMYQSAMIAEAMKIKPPALQGDIIRYGFGKPLDFDPGSRFAYSNFGYCLLGEAIRQVTGKSYKDCVKEEILAPLGITRMQLGESLVSAPGEVHYYQEGTGPAVIGKIGQQVPLPYGTFCLEAMDAHGGWIASAVDLMRFAAALDDTQHCPLLKPASFLSMYAPPAGSVGMQEGDKPKQTYYGCGWYVQIVDAVRGTGNAWHGGTMEGVCTLLVRRWDSINFAVLFNTRNGRDGNPLTGGVEQLLHKTASRIKSWPRYNLFAKLS